MPIQLNRAKPSQLTENCCVGHGLVWLGFLYSSQAINTKAEMVKRSIIKNGRVRVEEKAPWYIMKVFITIIDIITILITKTCYTDFTKSYIAVFIPQTTSKL